MRNLCQSSNYLLEVLTEVSREVGDHSGSYVSFGEWPFRHNLGVQGVHRANGGHHTGFWEERGLGHARRCRHDEKPKRRDLIWLTRWGQGGPGRAARNRARDDASRERLVHHHL